jgi:hypothetical protein
MNTVLLAIIAFGSIFSVTRHIVDEVQHYRWNKKMKALQEKEQQEWNDLV